MAESAHLNPAGRLARIFIRAKLAPLVMVAIVLFGLLAILKTPRTYNPAIHVPVVTVTVTRPGSNAREMLNQVVRPLEALVAAVPGVDHTYGMARNGLATVTVRFDVGQNKEKSLVKIYDQVNGNLDRLPLGARAPLIQSLSLYDVPILTIGLSSDRIAPEALRRVAHHLLGALRALPGVGKSWIQGVSAPAVRVAIDPGKLTTLHLSVATLVHTLEATDVTLPAGHLLTHGLHAPIRVEAAWGGVRSVGNSVVAVVHGTPIFLHEIARVSLGPKSQEEASFIGFGAGSPGGARPLRPAVTIALARKRGTNSVTVAKRILQRLETARREMIPKGVRITITRNDGAKANHAVNTLIEHLGISIAAVVLILLVFLGWREASIVAISIPLILFLVLGIGWLDGQSINRITLFALILSLGLLVDDSIVVIENIHRHIHHQAQANFTRLVIRAANEIGRPTIVATFTVILALIPMAFVTGMMGPFMAPIPFDAPVAMLMSLLVAYSFVPYLAYRALRTRGKTLMALSKSLSLEERDRLPQDWLHRLYVRLMTPLLHSGRARNGFLAAVALLLALALLEPLWQFIRPAGLNAPPSPLGVELKMLPNDNVNTLLIAIHLPSSTALTRTAAVTQAVARVVARDPDVTNYETYLGESAPEDFAALVRGNPFERGSDWAEIRVNLVSKSARETSSNGITRTLYRRLAPVRRRFPAARIELLETPPGPPVRSQMLAALYGPHYRELRHLAREIRHKDYPRIYGMMNIDDSVGQAVPEYAIRIRPHRARAAGLTPALIATEVRELYHGITVGDLRSPDAKIPVPVVVKLARTLRADPAALAALEIENPAGQGIPLASVATLRKIRRARPYYTRDQYPVVYISGHMLESSPVYGVLALTGMLDGQRLPGGRKLRVGNLGFVSSVPHNLDHVALYWLGEMRLTLNVFRDLGSAFLVALVLIYLLLVAYYRSFFLPVIVMGAIPLTLIGVFPGHALLGQPFTATSMIGVIALAGIVVRNSLLLIDFILERRAEGHPLDQAVLEAGAVRLRPILLTALAIIFGSSVMLTDPVFNGLAISLIFGAFASTVLTLFVIPLVYAIWQKRALGGHRSTPQKLSPSQESLP